MSNALVSLDDIIKKRKKTLIAMRSRGIKKSASKNALKANGTTSNQPKFTKPVEDARFKIIQKKRKHITDARDKLAQIAKQSDARLKLQKLRATVKKSDSVRKQIGHIGRTTVSSNKHAIPQVPSFIPPPTRNLSYRPPPIPQPHYINEIFMNYNNDYLIDQQAALRRTVSNDYAPSLPPPPPLFNIKPAAYSWDKPSHSSSLSRTQAIRAVEQSRPRDYKVIPRTGLSKSEGSAYRDDWTFNSKTRTIIPESALESKYYSIKNHRDVGVKSRLDSPPPKSTYSQVATNPRLKSSSQTPGYRIVVSNLQPNVTQEDIKELFEDVGELLVSRLVRPGIAEVIYKTLKDANKAVETYHNRQLDGHPMKCLLVRPKTSTTSSGRILSQSRSSSSYSQPSLGTVHRALFD